MRHLWYAAYGSNLSPQRLMTYLAGGVPAASESRQPQDGARDPSPPSADMPWATTHELYFAGQSRRWGGGGVAWLDPDYSDQNAGPTLCHAFRVTVSQFEDIHRQENGASIAQPLDLDRLVDSGRSLQYDRRYGLALVLGFHDDGLPVVTITSHRRIEPANAPSLGYIMTMGAGLHRSTGMDRDDIVDYLTRKEGLRGVHTSAEVRERLTAAAIERRQTRVTG